MPSQFSLIMRPLLAAAGRATPRRLAYSTKTKAAIASSPTDQVFPRPGFYDYMIDYKLPPRDHSGARASIPPPAPEPAKEPAPESKPAPEPKPAPPPKEQPPTTETPGKPTKARARKRNTDADKAPTAAEEPAAPSKNSKTSKTSKAKAAPAAAAAEEEKTSEEKAKVVFGASLSGPARRAEARSKGTLVAGVVVPPKPEEPDHCCMSGCVNCVWDQYREDMEDWIAAKNEAERRLAPRTDDDEAGGRVKAPLGTTVDDDGGGSDSNRSAEQESPAVWDESLYMDIPVGIREFMKVEKQLKEKHAREGTRGG